MRLKRLITRAVTVWGPSPSGPVRATVMPVRQLLNPGPPAGISRGLALVRLGLKVVIRVRLNRVASPVRADPTASVRRPDGFGVARNGDLAVRRAQFPNFMVTRRGTGNCCCEGLMPDRD